MSEETPETCTKCGEIHDPRKCPRHSSQTGKPCKNYPMHGSTVCDSHGGQAPQTKRKAAERLAAMKNDSYSLLAFRLRQEKETIEKKKELPEDAIAFRDLLAACKELTMIEELLAGRATSRTENVQIQQIIAAVYQVGGRYVPLELSADFMRDLDEITGGIIEGEVEE